MATWICKKCGEENGENTKTCLNCGEGKNSNITKKNVDKYITNEQYVCPICKSIYNSAYCSNCGRIIPGNCRKYTHDKVKTKSTHKKISPTLKFTFLCIATFVIVGTWSAASQSNSKNKSNSVNVDSSKPNNIIVSSDADDNTEIITDDNIETNIKDTESDGLVFKSYVPNDVTGNWRVAFMYDYEKFENVSIKEYIPKYYKKYFKNDDEIHFIINQKDKQTIRVSCGLGMLFVAVQQYVNNEENDANLLGSGAVLSEYQIDL